MKCIFIYLCGANILLVEYVMCVVQLLFFIWFVFDLASIFNFAYHLMKSLNEAHINCNYYNLIYNVDVFFFIL